jgi:hypothetical protein
MAENKVKASVAIQHIILMMNDTEMCKIRLENIQQVLVYLEGNHEDEGKPGDRGHLYRNLLASQISVNYDVEDVSHNNVLFIVKAAIALRDGTSKALKTINDKTTIDIIHEVAKKKPDKKAEEIPGSSV